MNGNCYLSDGVNPALTCNKNEGNRVAIPVLTPERATKRQNGRRLKEDREQSDDDNGNDVFALDKGIKPEERDVANCIEAREDRGLSKRKQEGTLICWKLK